MPKKTCPSCGKEHGPRKLECECGHSFGKQEKPSGEKKPRGRLTKAAKQWIGIGAWMLDRPSGMPEIDLPPPLPAKPALIATPDISRYIAYEGLGSCIYSYIDPDRIRDKKLRKLWEEAREKLQEVVKYVIEHERDS